MRLNTDSTGRRYYALSSQARFLYHARLFGLAAGLLQKADVSTLKTRVIAVGVISGNRNKRGRG